VTTQNSTRKIVGAVAVRASGMRTARQAASEAGKLFAWRKISCNPSRQSSSLGCPSCPEGTGAAFA
jgi:hypothetical protein